MSGGPGEQAAPSRRRLLVFYAFLATMVTIVAVVVVAAGHDRKAEPVIAGGYDSVGPNACMGPMFDLKQSGRFANLDNADGSISGQLKFQDGVLTGDVDCLKGGKKPLDATVADGRLAGTFGGQEVKAEQKRDPPEAGAQKPLAPSSIAGDYKITPRSACFGGALTVDGGSNVDLIVKEKAIGEAKYADGKLDGRVRCPDGRTLGVTGQAVDRNVNLTLLRPGVGPPEGRTVERATAEKDREAGSRFAAFFIAVAVVMLVARLFGMGAARLGQPRVMGEVVA